MPPLCIFVSLMMDIRPFILASVINLLVLITIFRQWNVTGVNLSLKSNVMLEVCHWDCTEVFFVHNILWRLVNYCTQLLYDLLASKT